MISPDCSTRCVVRDTRAADGDRFRWTVAVLGQLDPVAEGRAENREEARSLAEAALRTYAEKWRERSGGQNRND